MKDDTPGQPQHFRPTMLDRWDGDMLRAYIATLRAEIARAEAAINKLDANRSAAEAFF